MPSPTPSPNTELKFAPSQIGALPICFQAHQTNQKQPFANLQHQGESYFCHRYELAIT
jgi:hypothetical protein